MSFHRLAAVLLVILTFIAAVACRGKSEQELISDLIKDIDKKTEKRDLDGLMSRLDENYQDFEGRNKEATRQMVDEYFRHFRGIVIHLLSTKIMEIKTSEASIQTEVAISSGAAQVLRQLFSQWGECYRFTFGLKKFGKDWKIVWAQWENVPREGLFPESLEILKSLFPD